MPTFNVNVPTQIDDNLTASTTQGASKTAINTALALKANKVAITGATKTKITYNADGIVTGGADATTADIADSLNKRYQTDNQQSFNDATSSIQTQLNSRIKIVYSKTTDSSALTGTTVNTLVDSFQISANTFTVGDIPRLSIRSVFTGTAGNKTIRLYYNTSNTLAGATLFATSQGTSATLSMDMSRMMAIKSTSNTQSYQAAASSSAGDFNAAGAPAEVAVDWTAAVWIIIAIQLGSAADSAVVSMIKMTT